MSKNTLSINSISVRGFHYHYFQKILQEFLPTVTRINIKQLIRQVPHKLFQEVFQESVMDKNIYRISKNLYFQVYSYCSRGFN